MMRLLLVRACYCVFGLALSRQVAPNVPSQLNMLYAMQVDAEIGFNLSIGAPLARFCSYFGHLLEKCQSALSLALTRLLLRVCVKTITK